MLCAVREGLATRLRYRRTTPWQEQSYVSRNIGVRSFVHNTPHPRRARDATGDDDWLECWRRGGGRGLGEVITSHTHTQTTTWPEVLRERCCDGPRGRRSKRAGPKILWEMEENGGRESCVNVCGALSRHEVAPSADDWIKVVVSCRHCRGHAIRREGLGGHVTAK